VDLSSIVRQGVPVSQNDEGGDVTLLALEQAMRPHELVRRAVADAVGSRAADGGCS
jgi:hypothetical protein